jgi:hypothetical protein
MQFGAPLQKDFGCELLCEMKSCPTKWMQEAVCDEFLAAAANDEMQRHWHPDEDLCRCMRENNCKVSSREFKQLCLCFGISKLEWMPTPTRHIEKVGACHACDLI